MHRYLLLALFLVSSLPAFGQEKIPASINESAVQTDDGQPGYRVMVVMRAPKPGLPPSAAFASPSNYLGSTLSNDLLTSRSIADLPVVSVEVTADGLTGLENDPNVAFVIPDVPMALPETVSEAHDGSPTDYSVLFSNGTGTMVAVLDTGVDTRHAAFSGKRIVEACFSTNTSSLYRVESLCPNGTNVSTVPGSGANCDDTVSGCDHGTHVASIAVGNSPRLRGVAPNADLMAIQVFTLFNDPRVCGGAPLPCVRTFPSDQIAALNFVLDSVAQYNVVAANMSLGGGRHLTSCDTSSPIASTVNRLALRGVPVAIASGNNGYFNAVSNPGCVSSAITVTATDSTGKIDLSYANVSGDVDVAARGTRVMGALPGNRYGRKTGTSMATPFVAGMLALLKEIKPSLSLGEVNQTLNAAGSLVTDPRTGLSVPIADVNRSMTIVTSLVSNSSPILAPGARPLSEGDIRFLNSTSIVVEANQINAQSVAALNQLFPDSFVRQSANGLVVIEEPSGFTPRAINEIRSIVGQDVQIIDNSLEQSFRPSLE